MLAETDLGCCDAANMMDFFNSDHGLHDNCGGNNELAIAVDERRCCYLVVYFVCCCCYYWVCRCCTSTIDATTIVDVLDVWVWLKGCQLDRLEATTTTKSPSVASVNQSAVFLSSSSARCDVAVSELLMQSWVPVTRGSYFPWLPGLSTVRSVSLSNRACQPFLNSF